MLHFFFFSSTGIRYPLNNRLFLSRLWLTDNEKHVEAVIERGTNHQSRQAEAPESVAERGANGRDEAHRVARDQRWNSAIMVGYVTEY